MTIINLYCFAVTNSKKSGLPQLEVVSRVAAIPIVESSIDATNKMYYRIRVRIIQLNMTLRN